MDSPEIIADSLFPAKIFFQKILLLIITELGIVISGRFCKSTAKAQDLLILYIIKDIDHIAFIIGRNIPAVHLAFLKENICTWNCDKLFHRQLPCIFYDYKQNSIRFQDDICRINALR